MSTKYEYYIRKYENDRCGEYERDKREEIYEGGDLTPRYGVILGSWQIAEKVEGLNLESFDMIDME